MREIAAVTVGRSDFGIYLPIFRQLQSRSDVQLRIIVSGAHLLEGFGSTDREIEEAGFQIFERVTSLVEEDTATAIAASIGRGVAGFGELFSRYRPDILLVVGDRFDMFAAVLAALPFRIPVAHVHGGELTEGAIDDAIRHSMSKMSHLHFVATEEYRQRLEQLGEEAWRITVSGAPALDNINQTEFLTDEEIVARFGIESGSTSLLITFHPVTLESEETATHIDCLLDAIDRLDARCVFSYPGADTNHTWIVERIEAYARKHSHCRLVRNLGQRAYFSLLKTVSAMVGNSSSGIIEAASFRLPVVNVGNRQRGRTQARNVVNCGYATREIVAAVGKATDESFRESLGDLVNPYGDGHAADRIVERLVSAPLDAELTMKRFADMKRTTTTQVGG